MAPPPLKKFTLHPAAQLAPSSPLLLAQAAAHPLSIQNLTILRTALLASRTLAAERIIVKDANRRNLSERQASLNRVLEETQRAKEVERKRKREEDDRRERERAERVKSDAAAAAVLNGEKAALVAGDAALQLKQKRVREVNEKARADKVLALVKSSEVQLERTRDRAVPDVKNGRVAGLIEDEIMTDATSPSQSSSQATSPAVATHSVSTSSGAPILATTYVPSISAHTSAAPSPMVSIGADSSDAEDEFGQPKPPSRRKGGNDKHKRKREHIVDSDASGDARSDSTDSRVNDKHRKLERVRPRPSPSTSSANATPGPSNGHTLSMIRDRPSAISRAPSHGLSYLRQKLKDEKFVKHSIPTRPPAYGTASAFYLPTSSAIPPRPKSEPNPPTPKRQGEVCEDFTKAKVGTQIAFHTFHSWAEAYLRPFGEDDLAFLAPKPENSTLFIVPPLGKHYTDQWDVEDSDHPTLPQYASSLEPPALSRLRPESLTEDTVGMESVFVGPLTERLISALAFTAEEYDPEVLQEEEPKIKELDETGLADEERDRFRSDLDAVELEERIKKELRFIGIVGDEDVDWSHREDDEISTSLRSCQRLLQSQKTLNDSRKDVLASIVRDRMAYQDFETTRDAQERLIENGWNKRQKSGTKSKKSGGRERDRERERRNALDGNGRFGSVQLDQNGEPIKPPISLALEAALIKRERLVKSFQPFFEDQQDEGRFFGIPSRSVFDALDEEDALAQAGLSQPADGELAEREAN